MFGLSFAAQRGCWKLFHETATVQSLSPPEAPGEPPSPLLQPARAMAKMPSVAAILRMVIDCSSNTNPHLVRDLVFCPEKATPLSSPSDLA
jgi:hypothetical protein